MNTKNNKTLKVFSFAVSWHQLAVILISIVLVAFFLATPFFTDRVNILEDTVVSWTIFSPKQVEFQTADNKKATKALQEQAVLTVEDIYDVDIAKLQEVEDSLNNFFVVIKQLKQKKLTGQKRAEIKKNLPYPLPANILSQFIRTEKTTLNLLQKNTIDLMNKLMSIGILEKDEAFASLLEKEVANYPLPDSLKKSLASLLTKYLVPNKVYSAEKTQQKRFEARAKVVPIKTRIRKGQPIIYEGEVATEKHIEIFKVLDMYGSRWKLPIILGGVLFSLFWLLFFYFYLLKYKPAVFSNIRLLILLGILFVVNIFFAQLFKPISGFLVPLVLSTILIIVLIDAAVAAFFTIFAAVLITIVFNFDLTIFVVLISGSLAVLVSLLKINQRNDLTWAGFIAGAAQVFVVLLLSLFLEDFYYLSIKMIWAFLGGFMSAVVALGILPYLEIIFDAATSTKLLELAVPTQPLLKRLMLEAPGTYHHSLLVANLAEEATQAVGGNGLLARVASYYHDVGKIRRPLFFIENQKGETNPHDKVKPSMSTMIILSHPKDGVDIAREYRLPRALVDIVAQHHGTSVLSYFYQQSLKLGDVTEKDRDRFRYPGPKPQTIEAAIIMLADAVEAAVRSLEKTNLMRLEPLIQKIIRDKLEDGQLDETPLTLRDFHTIKNTFVRVFSGMFHQRIEYPEEENPSLE